MDRKWQGKADKNNNKIIQDPHTCGKRNQNTKAPKQQIKISSI